MNPQPSSGRPAEGRAWPCKKGWQRRREGRAASARLTSSLRQGRPIAVPGGLFQRREGHVQFRGPDSSHLLPASGQEPLRGPLQALRGLRNMPTLF